MNRQSAGILPSALQQKDQILEQLEENRPAIFLDYDGTLTPIVDDPEQALLPDQVKQQIERLAEHWTVVILSGRDLQDVVNMVGIDNLIYAGSHGFDIQGPDGSYHIEPGKEYLPVLEQAEKHLEKKLEKLNGVRLERKRYAIALHYRGAEQDAVSELEKQVDAAVETFSGLRKTAGKKIFELRPNIDWDKGRALLYLLDALSMDESCTMPLYIGDDETDEDGFRALSDRGIGILVTEGDQETAASYTLQDPDKVAEFLSILENQAEKESELNIWSFAYTGFKPDSEKHREALCTVGNGYFATRGAAPESSANEVHYPGTYAAGVYNRLKSTVSGETVENESLVNVPNWLPLSFCIDDGEPFEADSADIIEYHQELDLQCGILERTVRFQDEQGRRTRLVQRWFVHMRHRHVGGLETTIEAENWSGTLHIRSALDGRVENTLVERYRQLNNHHLEQLGTGVTDDRLMWIQVMTNQSKIRIAEAGRIRLFMDKERIEKTGRMIQEPGYIGQEFDVDVKRGNILRIEKIITLYNSRDSAISECLMQAQEHLRHTDDFVSLMNTHILAWQHLWERWRVSLEIPGRRIQQVLNLHIFQLLQTVSPKTVDLDAGVPPRGLHGEAYRGLIMWDELFILPLLNMRIPDISRTLLMYRYRRLPQACWAASEAGYQGAMYPWQSGSDGQEQAQTLHLNPESGRWIPDHTQLQRHINIAVAYNIWQYYQVTGDMDFMCFYGADMFFKIARFWADKAEYNESTHRYDIRKVMGPDEFHEKYPDASEPGIDNNAYTNIMAAWVFWRALDLLEELPQNRKRFIMEDLNLEQKEIDHWDELSRKIRVVFHDDGIISQFEGYGELKEFDWEAYKKKHGNIHRLDRILEAEDDSPDRYKVSKQADVLMLFYLLSADELRHLFDRLDLPFSYETIPNNIEYYLKRTSHGSTLSSLVHAWVLMRSKREMSWRLFQDALESDVRDVQGGTTPEGIHLGAMAGTVDLITRCYSGIEARDGVLWFHPRLPSELKSLKFGVEYRKTRIFVDIAKNHLRLTSGNDSRETIRVGYDGTTLLLKPGEEKQVNF
ncbi:MAG: trehalose-phosphatase [candidate division KSB1 bacterium]|nr:trehalose-phosphatase [candidate division KSB1 bacterium]